MALYQMSYIGIIFIIIYDSPFYQFQKYFIWLETFNIQFHIQYIYSWALIKLHPGARGVVGAFNSSFLMTNILYWPCTESTGPTLVNQLRPYNH